jgi:hypothetical protein
MEKKKNRFFQTAYISGDVSQSEPFDIVIGSGRKGQTYLYWKDDKIFQLPVSYYTPTDSWVNSPGLLLTSFISTGKYLLNAWNAMALMRRWKIILITYRPLTGIRLFMVLIVNDVMALVQNM